MKIQLTKLRNLNDRFNNANIEYDFDGETIEDMLFNYACFLRAIGFSIKGDLVIDADIESLFDDNDVPEETSV